MNTTLNSKQSEAAKYAELDYLLSDKVDDIISLSQTVLLEVDSIGANSQAEKNINEILEKFDIARDKFKRKYNKELTKQTHSYVHATIELTEKEYIDNEEGIKNWWNNLGKIIKEGQNNVFKVCGEIIKIKNIRAKNYYRK